MKNAVLGIAAVVVCASACADAGPGAEETTASSSQIQGGVDDTVHSFAVAVVLLGDAQAYLCSGALLAPNLVATARHCVAALPATLLDCATTRFGSVVAPSDLVVTTDSILTATSTLYGVSQIVVPTGPDETLACGNDIALLILSQNVHLSQYVTPVIAPPMTDHTTYSTSVAAIGYGVSTPSDPSGATAGTRRIRENVAVACIPNDKSFVDCFPSAAPYMSAKEFQTGDGTCEGDSGSGAFDQGSFSKGHWVSFGVLSRGGSDADGGTCVGGIATRFDAWGPLLIDAAQQAAFVGGYPLPNWATPASDGGAASGAGDTGSSVQDACACSTEEAEAFVSDGGDIDGEIASLDANEPPRITSVTTSYSCATLGGEPAPVPSRMAPLALGLTGLALARRRRSRSASRIQHHPQRSNALS